MKLLLIADIHANYEALQTVLEIPHDRAICLGDIVDYGPDPDKCIDLLRKKEIPTIRGNHDNAVAFKVDCQCGYKYKHLSIATREYTWEILDRDRMEYLQKLPLLIKEEIDGKKLYLTHASPRSMFEYIKPETPDEEIRNMINEAMEPVEAEFLSGRAFSYSHEQETWKPDNNKSGFSRTAERWGYPGKLCCL